MKIITYPEVEKMIKENKKILLIDLREYEEYKEHHIDGAVNIPEDRFISMQEDEDMMFKEIVEMYRKGYNIILYCARGNESMIMAKRMHSCKIEVFSLYGGINEYDKYMKYVENNGKNFAG